MELVSIKKDTETKKKMVAIFKNKTTGRSKTVRFGADGYTDYTISKDNRIGDHIWYISDVNKFKNHYPNWDYKYNIDDIINEMIKYELKK
jgi:hypothetical protein